MMLMSKTIPRLLLLPVFVLLALLCGGAAAEGNAVSVEIPVCVQAKTGETATDAVSYFGIEAVDNAPLPLQSSLCIEGAGSAAFGPISYTRPGDYRYTVRQTSALATYRRDTTVYNVTVRVVTGDTGLLSTEVWAVKSTDPKTKVTCLRFTAAKLIPTPTAKPTAAPTAGPAKSKTATTARTVSATRHGLPQTRDDFNLWPLLLCCAGSAAALVFLKNQKKR